MKKRLYQHLYQINQINQNQNQNQNQIGWNFHHTIHPSELTQSTCNSLRFSNTSNNTLRTDRVRGSVDIWNYRSAACTVCNKFDSFVYTIHIDVALSLQQWGRYGVSGMDTLLEQGRPTVGIGGRVCFESNSYPVQDCDRFATRMACARSAPRVRCVGVGNG